MHELRQRGEAEHAVDDDHIALFGFDLAHDKGAQVLRHRSFDLEAHDVAQPALFQARFELAHQVLGLFLDFDVAVAHHPEGADCIDFVAGEELVQEQHDRVLERDEAARRALAFNARLLRARFRHFDEAVHLRRHRDQRVQSCAHPRRDGASARWRSRGSG